MGENIVTGLHRNKKYGRSIVIALIVAVMLLISIKNYFCVPSIIRQTYLDYLDTISYDYDQAVTEFCHFEDEFEELMTRNSSDYLTSYKILKWEKINDDLWAVHMKIKTLSIPDGAIGYNFIGNFSGEYKVMLNCFQIPENLKADINIKKYMPTDMVDPECVISPIG